MNCEKCGKEIETYSGYKELCCACGELWLHFWAKRINILGKIPSNREVENMWNKFLGKEKVKFS